MKLSRRRIGSLMGDNCPGVISMALLHLLATGTLSLYGQSYADRESAVERISMPTADHRQFEILQQDFRSGPEVTEACLSCHNQAAKQVMQSLHWTWNCQNSQSQKGKSKVINNFCIGVTSNEARCTSCHVGYGWTDKRFQQTADESKVDCLVCHDRTGSYQKYPSKAGHPLVKGVDEPKLFDGKRIYEPVDLKLVAQQVGTPGRHNCGACHFSGGGGPGVKHGNLDPGLLMPSRELDVHMDAQGANFLCQTCHVTKDHITAGNCSLAEDEDRFTYSRPGARVKATHLSCQNCHDSNPHKQPLINQHARKLSCQACHIPYYARSLPSKSYWDWSVAGKRDANGKALIRKERIQSPDTGREAEVLSYHGMKGRFEHVIDAKPEYHWYDGKLDHLVVGERVEPKEQPIRMSYPTARPGAANARIFPFKVHRGKQAYDTELAHMILPRLFGPEGSGAYWSDWDWNLSFQTGMEAAELAYSGNYDWAETEMYWPISHMVPPKEDSVACIECHRSENSRMAGVPGIWVPGLHKSKLDRLGWALITLSLTASLLHGLGRIVMTKRQGNDEK